MFDYTWGADETTHDRIVGYVAEALEEALKAKANVGNARLLWVRFRAEAMYEPDQPEAA